MKKQTVLPDIIMPQLTY